MSPLYLLIYIFCLFVSIGISIEMIIKKGIKAIPIFIFVFLFALITFQMFDFERCLDIETENLTIEQIKINKDNYVLLTEINFNGIIWKIKYFLLF